MGILIIILKITGVILLVLLGLIALILFCPIRYRLDLMIDKEMEFDGRVTWLCGIFRFDFARKDAVNTTGFWIFGYSGRKSATEKETAEAEGEPETDTKESMIKSADRAEQNRAEKTSVIQQAEQEKELEQSVAQSAKQQNESKQSMAQAAEQNPAVKKETPGTGTAEKHSKEKTAKKKKRKQDRQSESAVHKMSERIKDTANRQAVLHVLRELLHLLARISPESMKGELSFSAGDPAYTGELTGILSLLPVCYSYDMQICPDFMAENAYLRGTVRVRGHLALIHIVTAAIRLLLDADVRKLLAEL